MTPVPGTNVPIASHWLFTLPSSHDCFSQHTMSPACVLLPQCRTLPFLPSPHFLIVCQAAIYPSSFTSRLPLI